LPGDLKFSLIFPFRNQRPMLTSPTILPDQRDRNLCNSECSKDAGADVMLTGRLPDSD